MSFHKELLRDLKNFKVLLKRGEFVDSQRNSRVVPYKIYYPIEHMEKAMPIVLWSHGFGGNMDGASYLSRFIASEGYIVVHMTHLGTDSSLWEGKEGHPWDILRQIKLPRESTLNRMYDIPFVLDQLALWAKENEEVGRHMDFSRIGMSGHSFGAMTTQVMAGMLIPDHGRQLINLREKRIQAGILYSPVPIRHLTDAPSEEVYGGIDIPLFHMTGTEDVSPIEGFGYLNRLVVKQYADHPEQYLQILEGGDHMVYNGTRGKLAVNPLREAHEEEIKFATLIFWNAYLKNDSTALKWLKEQYS